MSAPDNAYRIDKFGGDDISHIKVSCPCGWHGHLGELLGVDDEETLWCPWCRTAAWTYD